MLSPRLISLSQIGSHSLPVGHDPHALRANAVLEIPAAHFTLFLSTKPLPSDSYSTRRDSLATFVQTSNAEPPPELSSSSLSSSSSSSVARPAPESSSSSSSSSATPRRRISPPTQASVAAAAPAATAPQQPTTHHYRHRRSLSSSHHNHFSGGRLPPTIDVSGLEDADQPAGLTPRSGESDLKSVFSVPIDDSSGSPTHSPRAGGDLAAINENAPLAGSATSPSTGNTPTRRRGRHHRQLSAPVVGGVEGEPESLKLVAEGELKLAEGLVLTRGGVSSMSSPLAGRSPVVMLSKTPSHPGLAPPAPPREGSDDESEVKIFNKEELELVGHLGKGTAGTVSKYLHVTALKIVAVKSVPVFDVSKRDTIVAEIKALFARMEPLNKLYRRNALEDESNIVGFYDAFLSKEGASINIVLEYMDGGSLQDIIDARGALPEEFISVACRCMLHGLLELHEQRLLHRDLKPANVLVSRKGTVKLSDFGVSVGFGLGSVPKARTFVGSLSYMAPERLLGGDDGYSYEADLWAVGLITYVCATGIYPYTKAFDDHGFFGVHHAITEAPSPQLTRGSDELKDFVNLCLVKEPGARPTALALINHPFVNRVTDPVLARRAVADMLPPINKDEAHKYFDALMQAVADFHSKRAFSMSHTLPRFSKERLEALALQVGLALSPDEVEAVLRDLQGRLLGGQRVSATSSPSSSTSGVMSPAHSGLLQGKWKKGNLRLDVTM